ncbi:MAG: sugar-transfer associated ATP-grasp domain-containing protein [Oscillospiraceae bacterium]|nr:sugar-transfer associated ATP-grasp domain-containing protein [Oscillospiraceae bacterium]
MKNSVKDKIFRYMFDTLWKNRREDIERAVSAIKSGEKRSVKSDALKKWFIEMTGQTKELTAEQLDELKSVWGDIWDTGLVDPLWVQVYSDKTGIYSPEYVGSDIHYYNVEWSRIDYDYLRAFLDKNYMDVVLPCVKHPVTLIRKIHGQYLDVDFNPMSKPQAIDKLYENLDPGIVVKISRSSSGGKGVRFLGKGSTKEDISEALDVDPDVAVQLVMRQHPEMAKMNASSVNTIRIICIILDGESIPLSAVVRIGNSGSRVDNFSSGGVGCGVKPDGRLNDCGYTQKGERYDVHPNGFVFSEGFVPNFDKVLEAVKRCHMCVPMFGVASWDIAIDEDGEPVLIEYNVGGAGIDIHQYNNGPLYGKYRERIISDAFKNYAERSATLDFNYSIAHGEVTVYNGSRAVHDLIIPCSIGENSVCTIGDNAFKNSSELESVTVEAALNEIGYLAFYNCSRLKNIEFKKPVGTISRSAFNRCTALESIALPHGCKKICTYAFRTCKSLRKIVIPSSVDIIEPDAFLESPNVVIYCKKDSAAERYAIENGLKYKN